MAPGWGKLLPNRKQFSRRDESADMGAQVDQSGSGVPPLLGCGFDAGQRRDAAATLRSLTVLNGVNLSRRNDAGVGKIALNM